MKARVRGILITALLAGCASQPYEQSSVPSAPKAPPVSVEPAESVEPPIVEVPESEPTQRRGQPVSPPVRVDRVRPNEATLGLLAQADHALSAGSLSTASLWLERAQRSAPNAGEVYLAMARLRMQQLRWQEAEQLCLKAASLAGTDQDFKAQVEKVLQQVRRREARLASPGRQYASGRFQSSADMGFAVGG